MSVQKRLIVTLVILTLLIGACTAGEEPAAAPDLRSDVSRESDPDVTPGNVGEVVAGNNRFALDLFHAVAETEGNLFFSPYSISTALAMTYAGARGETATEMGETLHYTLPQAELHAAVNALNLQLTGNEDGEDFELAVANALWGQEGKEFHQEFLDLLAAQYGAGLRLVDFSSAEGQEAASERINEWVSDATEEKITDLVNPQIFTDLTRLVLTNAIYFNGLWEQPFDGNTREAAFTLPDGSTVTVPLMSRRADSAYASGDGWLAAELPYQGARASMLILLPAEGEFETFSQELDAAQIEEILAALAPTDLKLYLPRFEYAAEMTLADTLAGMGMPLAFSDSEADFSGMAEIPPRLYIAHVLHKAYVAVDELGTEAAAATAVVMEEESMPEEMRVDRPFLFLIRDTEQGTILFLGRVVNPAAS